MQPHAPNLPRPPHFSTPRSMSKLTVTFKGIPLQSIELERDEISIGRNPSNAVYIDSLALADFHAMVKFTQEGYVIQQLQMDFPVYLNGRPVSRERLDDGDHILIGKHDIYFSQRPPAPRTTPLPEPGPTNVFRAFEGSFQVMNGKKIGMVIPLKQTLTQIGKGPTGLVVVNKGDAGYTISPKDGEVLLTVNGNSLQIGEEVLLQNNDIVRINSSLLLFFQK